MAGTTQIRRQRMRRTLTDRYAAVMTAAARVSGLIVGKRHNHWRPYISGMAGLAQIAG